MNLLTSWALAAAAAPRLWCRWWSRRRWTCRRRQRAPQRPSGRTPSHRPSVGNGRRPEASLWSNKFHSKWWKLQVQQVTEMHSLNNWISHFSQQPFHCTYLCPVNALPQNSLWIEAASLRIPRVTPDLPNCESAVAHIVTHHSGWGADGRVVHSSSIHPLPEAKCGRESRKRRSPSPLSSLRSPGQFLGTDGSQRRWQLNLQSDGRAKEKREHSWSQREEQHHFKSTSWLRLANWMFHVHMEFISLIQEKILKSDKFSKSYI